MSAAPHQRRVDMLTGAKAPDAFFNALSEATEFCRELDDLRAKQCRIDELEAENRELRARVAAYRGAGDAR